MKIASAIGLIIFAIVLFIACPLGLIWALNTLFSLHIPFTIPTWSAAAVLYYSFSRSGRFNVTKNNKND